ncbi:S41 family peptidase [Ruficoccus amylovorans]|uniref:S41 family peptidase n=1 Tax=Ruficoccus amylovorans TaxID=1804625 RepID=A0A842HG54_9BACT|nr:S41 family peptidase [Ruficoccus amylovorans]MBC2594557.1 S41 family peptidase [Ruficoccus amylovorans]
MIKYARQWLIYLLVFFGTGVLLLIFMSLVWLQPHQRDLFSLDFWRNIFHVGQVMLLTNDSYVETDKVGYDDLSTSALKQMIHGLDEYSGYMDHDDYVDFTVHTDQHYAGIGAEVERIDSRVTIAGLFEKSPALAAGLRVGDEIVRVGDLDAAGWSVTEMVERLRGPVGETVALSVYRPSEGRELDFSFRREAIDFPSVREVGVGPDGIGFMRISGFGRNTGSEFRVALSQLEFQGMQALIIDLRGNPGGLLTEAVAVAGEFLPDDTLIVTTRGRDGTVINEERTTGTARQAHYPVAILIDASSASASEIVAGALQDLGKAVIIGETSFGKGSVQRVYEFANGDGLRLTSAMYYLPSGRTIHKEGVIPDIAVPVSTRAALGQRLQYSHLRLMDPQAFEARFGFAPVTDQAIERAREVLRGLLAYRAAADAS